MKLWSFIRSGTLTSVHKLPDHFPPFTLGMIAASLQLKGDRQVFFRLLIG
ncbi:MAG: hypothetical protein PHY28_06310 [Dehalococcoidales bacterium]|nr:hypothetical protein [Dehalococcoidales bacterium]